MTSDTHAAGCGPGRAAANETGRALPHTCGRRGDERCLFGRRDVSIPATARRCYEGHFEDCRSFAAREHSPSLPLRACPIAGSSLVRRLVLAKDDPAKQRIRAWLSDIDDERLFCLGLTSEDIAALRGTASPPAEAAIAPGLDATASSGRLRLKRILRALQSNRITPAADCRFLTPYPEDSLMTTLLDKQRSATSNVQSPRRGHIGSGAFAHRRARADGRAARSRH